MYNRTGIGPRKEPWATPQLTGYSCKDSPSRTTQSSLLLRKEEIRPNTRCCGCSGYHYCTTSFNKVWTQILQRFKFCSHQFGGLRWCRSLGMVLAGNKAKCLWWSTMPEKQFILIIIIIWPEILWGFSLWKRTACQTLSNTLDVSTAAPQLAPDLWKALAILLDTTVRRSAIDREVLLLTNFSKTLLNTERRLTGQ